MYKNVESSSKVSESSKLSKASSLPQTLDRFLNKSQRPSTTNNSPGKDIMGLIESIAQELDSSKNHSPLKKIQSPIKKTVSVPQNVVGSISSDVVKVSVDPLSTPVLKKSPNKSNSSKKPNQPISSSEITLSPSASTQNS